MGDSWRRSQSESLQQNIRANQSGDRRTRRAEQTCVCPSNSWRFRWTPVTRFKGRIVLDSLWAVVDLFHGRALH